MHHKETYIWGLLARFAPQGIYLLTTIVLARFVTPEEFGQIGILAIFFSLAQVLTDSGFGGSLIKETAISIDDCSTVSSFNIGVSSLLYLLMFLFAGKIEVFYSIEGLSSVIRVLCIVFIINSFGIVPLSILYRRLQVNRICINSVISVSIAAIVSIVSAILGAGVYSLVLYQLVHSFIKVVADYIVSKYRFKLGFSISSFRKLFPFGAFTTLTSVIDSIYNNLLNSFIGKFMNVAEAGYMYQARRLEEGLTSSVSLAVNNVTFPILTKYKDDIEEFKTEARSTFKTIILLSFPVFLTASVFAEPIILLFYGEQWMGATFYLETLIFAGLFAVMESLNRNFIKALCEVQKLMYLTIIKRIIGICLIVGALLISSRLMVFAYILSTGIGYVINMFLYGRLTNQSFRRQIGESLICILPSLVYWLFMYIIIHLLLPNSLILQILFSIAGLSIYYLIVMKLYGIDVLQMINHCFVRIKTRK